MLTARPRAERRRPPMIVAGRAPATHLASRKTAPVAAEKSASSIQRRIEPFLSSAGAGVGFRTGAIQLSKFFSTGDSSSDSDDDDGAEAASSGAQSDADEEFGKIDVMADLIKEEKETAKSNAEKKVNAKKAERSAKAMC